MRTIGQMFVVAILSAVIAATAGAVGVDLSWNDCVTSPTAATNKNFDCTGTQNQNYSLMLQFKSPIDMPNFVALTAYVDLGPFGTPLAPFWHYERNTGCNRMGAFVIDAIPESCVDQCFGDLWGGGFEAFEALAAYAADYQRPGRGRFVLLVARGDGIPLKAEVNYFGLELRFNNDNRATCVGCGEGKFLIFNLARLESNDGSPAVDLSGADKSADCATINGGTSTSCTITVPTGPRLASNPPCGPTPAVRQTWGTLKSLYR